SVTGAPSPARRSTLSEATSAAADQARVTAPPDDAAVSFASFGGDESWRNENGAAALLLPALSSHRPLTDAVGSSGFPYMTLSQAPIPEVASLPVYVTVTGRLYQPFRSGGRSAAAPSTVGGVESYWSANDAVPVLPALSRHVPVTAAAALSGPE